MWSPKFQELIRKYGKTILNKNIVSKVKKQNPSKSHHYLPIFYQKGFVKGDGKHFVLDKEQDKILPPSIPKNKFVVNKLNTRTIHGKKDTFIEDVYFNEIDGLSSRVLTKIKDTREEEISFSDKAEFAWFICNLFWRIPSSKKALTSILKNEGLENLVFDFCFDDQKVIPKSEEELKILSEILNNNNLSKTHKLIMPFNSFYSGEILAIMKNWNELNVLGENVLVTGDNPFIRKNLKTNMGNVLGEFIFPISEKNLLTTSKEKLNVMNSELFTLINLAVLHQSDRFICCSSFNYLNQLRNIYADFLHEKEEGSIINLVFECIDKLSVYESDEEYRNDLKS